MEAAKQATIEDICNQLNELVIDNLKASKAAQALLSAKDKKDVQYVPASDCEKLLKAMGKLIVRECISVHTNHREETDEKIDNLSDKIVNLTKELELTREELIQTKLEMDKQNQYGRREMIRIHNIPEPTLQANQYENVHDTVVTVLQAAGIEIEENMISSAQRLPVRRSDAGNKTKPITFKLTRRYDRNRVLRLKKTHMKDNVEFQTKYPRVFMTEDLTPLRQHMAYLLRKDDRLAVSWSIDGRLKCLFKNYKKEDKPITIDTPQDLGKLGWSEGQIAEIIKTNLLKNKA